MLVALAIGVLLGPLLGLRLLGGRTIGRIGASVNATKEEEARIRWITWSLPAGEPQV